MTIGKGHVFCEGSSTRVSQRENENECVLCLGLARKSANSIIMGKEKHSVEKVHIRTISRSLLVEGCFTFMFLSGPKIQSLSNTCEDFQFPQVMTEPESLKMGSKYRPKLY
jgi:hypothetical protein